MGVGEGLSDTEGVVSTLFLIRYQTVIASKKETNFASQFSSVSLVHRMETNIERQFFEVCPSIFAPCSQKRRHQFVILPTFGRRQFLVRGIERSPDELGRDSDICAPNPKPAYNTATKTNRELIMSR